MAREIVPHQDGNRWRVRLRRPARGININERFDTEQDAKDFIDKTGEVYIVAGGVPDFEPEKVKDKYLFVTGDCWKLFPSKDKVEEAMKLAKKVIEYPGCAPVYIFAQLNGALQALYQECGGVLCPLS